MTLLRSVALAGNDAEAKVQVVTRRHMMENSMRWDKLCCAGALAEPIKAMLIDHLIRQD